MRDAIGGAMLLNLVLVFVSAIILLFVSVLSYSKAYRIKNRIVEVIEKNELYDQNVGVEINDDLTNTGYNTDSPIEKCKNIKTNLSANKYNNLSNNLNDNYGYYYCVFEVCNIRDDEEKCIDPNGKYYVVTTFIKFDIPIVGDTLMFPVYGETKMLGKDYNY